MTDHLAHPSLIVDAEYRDDVPPMYAGNPFIEALPRFATTRSIAEALRRMPEYSPEWRRLPDDQRLLQLPSLRQVYQPLSRDVDAFRRVYAEILASYAGRSASDPAYLAKVVRSGETDPPEIALDRPDGYAPASVLILGLPGSGKSSATGRWLSAIPQAIRHSSYRGRSFCTTQVTWVRVDCPADGSPKTLCGDLFQGLDAILGTHYHRRYNRRSASAAERLEQVRRWGALHGVALVVVDNLENLQEAQAGAAGLLVNFLYKLATALGAVVVLVGTYAALPILSGAFRQLRRQTELGWERWERFTDCDWERVLRSLWRIQYTRDPTDLTPELSDAMFGETLGIGGLVWVLYKLVQERAITTRDRTGSERITPELIHSVAHDNFGLVAGALDALRRGKSDPTVRFPDLPPELHGSAMAGLSVSRVGSAGGAQEGPNDTEKPPSPETSLPQSAGGDAEPEPADPDPTAVSSIVAAAPEGQSAHEALVRAGIVTRPEEWLTT